MGQFTHHIPDWIGKDILNHLLKSLILSDHNPGKLLSWKHDALRQDNLPVKALLT
jgi:hypothetical protein